jgi:hypothetical protein
MRLFVNFTFTQFDFYLNGKPWKTSLDADETCDENELITIFDTYEYGIFHEITALTINYQFQSPNSNFKNWCPLIFKNANLDRLVIQGKPVRFFTGNSSYNINSRIQEVHFNNIVTDYFDKEMLHPQVFSLSDSVFIIGSLKKIETDVFKELRHLQYISLHIYHFTSFIHGNGIEWMNYLNYYKPRLNMSIFELECDLECLLLLNSSVLLVDLGSIFSNDSKIENTNFSLSSFPYMIPYTFPNEDFCIFANYPHNTSVLIVAIENHQDCTCSKLWMSKNAALLASNNQLELSLAYTPFCSSLVNDFFQFNQSFNACGFLDKYTKCQLNMVSLNQSLASYTDSYFQFYDAQYVLIEIRNILKNYFDYWVLVVGFLTNIITAIVIINAYAKASVYSNNKDNQLGSIKENFFTYMLINSIINSIYCVVMFFNETLPYVPIPNGEDCYVREVCIATTASVLKLTANVTYLQMSLNRYLLVGKDHAEWLKKVGKANIIIVLIAALISSCLLSYVVVEQGIFFNNTGEKTRYFLSTHSESIYENVGYMSYVNVIENLKSIKPYIITLTIIYDFISYFLFVVLNLIVDVMTVVKLKETLDHKASIGVQSKEKKEEQERAERRSIIMVVLNSLVNILLRIPELLSIIFFFIISWPANGIMITECSKVTECTVVTQISDSFFNFTMICNIFFYYFFNKTFKFAFQLIFTLNSKNNQTKK